MNYLFAKLNNVYSLDAVNCRNGICFEGAEGLTINDKTSADVTIPVSPSRVTLKFYAYADMNQMPIRDVKIDWNDGSSPIQLSGCFPCIFIPSFVVTELFLWYNIVA
ncbi:hypothetical protein EPN28_01885 [Patescibacteria group bacterium]|nr:MAG: hypothetical protein EPN28_01885 [Patescibacteria group bacterium]